MHGSRHFTIVEQVRMAGARASVPAGQATTALESATAFGCMNQEVVWLVDLDSRKWMPWTYDLERVADATIGIQYSQDLCPHGDMLNARGVSDDVHAVLGAR